MDTKQHNRSITNAAAKALHDCLNSAGWAKNIIDLYGAGELLSKDIIKFGDMPQGQILLSVYNEWADVLTSFTLNEKQFKTCVKAIRFGIEQGGFSPNKHSLTLLQAFKLEE